MPKAVRLVLWIGFTAFLIVFFTIPWEPSFLVDEFIYAHRFVQHASYWSAFSDFASELWSDYGRFQPLKHLINVGMWYYFPDNSLFSHYLFLAVFLANGFLVSKTVSHLIKTPYSSLLPIVFGFLFLQIPLLHGLFLVSTSELLVSFFVLWGFYLFITRRPSYRLAFLLGFLLKEPAIVAFFATSIYWFVVPRLVERKKAETRKALFDLLIFTAGVGIVLFAMRQGAYLSDYSIVSIETGKNLLIAARRLAIGLAPLLAISLYLAWKTKLTFSKLVKSLPPTLFVLIIFSTTYLVLASGKSAAHYLLPPVSASLLTITVYIFVSVGGHFRYKADVWVPFFLLYSLFAGYSFDQIRKFTDSAIGVPQVIRKSLAETPEAAIGINNHEAAISTRLLVDDLGLKTVIVNTLHHPEKILLHSEKSLHLFELTRVSGKYSKDFLKKIQGQRGAWTSVENRRTFRVLVSTK